jgi:uncharacterized RDD family membrane protein YckC
MKPVGYPQYFLLLLLSLGLALYPAAQAQETPPPAAPQAPAVPEEPKQPEPPAAADADEDKPQEAATEPSPVVATEAKPEAAAAESTPETEPSGERDDKPRHQRHSRRSGNERVSFGGNSTLAEGESAEAVISIFGSSTSSGDVSDAVVSIIGSSRVEGGTVGDAVVSVLGNTYINGEVRGEVVAVMGNVELGPQAVVRGEVVCIGGQLKRDGRAVVKGNVQNIAVAGRHFDFSALTAWFTECLLYGRPLAFDGRLVWAWTIALGLLGFYALIALIAPAGVVKCAETLEQRPGSSLLSALLTMLLTPVAFILLALTLFIAVGFVLIPLMSFGLFLASIFGRIVMLAWLGRRFTKLLGDGPLAHPVFGVLIGGVVVLGLYTIPIVGFITYKLLGILGLGVVVYTLLLQFKASRPPKPVMAAAVPVAGIVAASAEGETAGAVPPPVAPMVSGAPPVISAATLPRAGFWLRFSAAFLDFILVFVTSLVVLQGILDYHGGPGLNFLLWIVYHPVMWKLKGTTIGGIICGLKVVRLDDRPIDWSVAIVRTITAFMSFCVAGIGFIWVAFDDERQSWHDKVAGTTIVVVPKGMALL